MQRNILWFFVVFLSGFAWHMPAKAILDIRFSGIYSKPEGLGEFQSNMGYEKTGMMGTGLDIVASPPLMGAFGGGLRISGMASYVSRGKPEIAGLQDALDAGHLFVGASRVALLGRYWVLDTPLFWVGPVATLGIWHPFITVKEWKAPNNSDLKLDATWDKYDTPWSCSLAINGGLDLKVLSLGAEVGYMWWDIQNIRTDGGVKPQHVGGDKAGEDIQSLNLGGLYFALSLGWGF